jgi:hypothetical protein
MRFAGISLIQSPSDGLERRPLSMKKGRESSGGRLRRPVRAGAVVVAGGEQAHLSIASWWEEQADWSSLRWRISLRTVRRPGGRWRLRERRVGPALPEGEFAAVGTLAVAARNNLLPLPIGGRGRGGGRRGRNRARSMVAVAAARPTVAANAASTSSSARIRERCTVTRSRAWRWRVARGRRGATRPRSRPAARR